MCTEQQRRSVHMLTTNPPESIFAFYFLIRPRKKKQKKRCYLFIPNTTGASKPIHLPPFCNLITSLRQWNAQSAPPNLDLTTLANEFHVWHYSSPPLGGIKRLTQKDRQVPGGHRLPPFVGAICPRGKSKAKNPKISQSFRRKSFCLRGNKEYRVVLFGLNLWRVRGTELFIDAARKKTEWTMKVTWIWVCLAGSEEFIYPSNKW